MKINHETAPEYLAAAKNVIASVEKIASAVAKYDNVDKVDLNSEKGEILVDRKQMLAQGVKDGIIIPDANSGSGVQYKDDVQVGKVSFDPQNGKIKNADVQSLYYYDCSYGRSAESHMHYKVEEKTEKDGFLGLFGDPRARLIYSQSGGELSKDVTKVDKETGEIVEYKTKRGFSFGQALIDNLKSPSFYFLTAIAGALTGVPGTLTGTLFGPIAGVVGAGITALGLTIAKKKMG
jgi:hypothetical protein